MKKIITFLLFAVVITSIFMSACNNENISGDAKGFQNEKFKKSNLLEVAENSFEKMKSSEDFPEIPENKKVGKKLIDNNLPDELIIESDSIIRLDLSYFIEGWNLFGVSGIPTEENKNVENFITRNPCIDSVWKTINVDGTSTHSRMSNLEEFERGKGYRAVIFNISTCPDGIVFEVEDSSEREFEMTLNEGYYEIAYPFPHVGRTRTRVETEEIIGIDQIDLGIYDNGIATFDEITEDWVEQPLPSYSTERNNFYELKPGENYGIILNHSKTVTFKK